jgi:hypothetical protein
VPQIPARRPGGDTVRISKLAIILPIGLLLVAGPLLYLSSAPRVGGGANPAKRTSQTGDAGGGLFAPDDDAACQEKMRKLGVVSSAPCIDVGAIVNDLTVGTYVFNTPKKTVYVGDSFHLLLALKTSPSQDVASDFKNRPGTVNEREGKFAQSIEATLNGDDMQVEPAGPQERTATTAEPVEWEWKLTPQSGGDKTLTVEVAANIQVGPDKRRVQVRTLHEPITIRVSIFQQIKMYVAQANGIVVAAATTITALAGIFGFVPPVRDFLLKLSRWRRRNGAA